MLRHPGLQSEMRMKEIATAITRASGEVQAAFSEFRELEKKAAELKSTVAVEQKKLGALLKLQSDLVECQRWTEFGLPAGMTTVEFAGITGHTITS